jgi:hypothetical protein
MRMPILLAVLAVSSVAFAETSPSGSVAPQPKDLRPDEIRERVKGLDDVIAQCYLGNVDAQLGNGKLDITLDIHRKGIVDKITIAAPGVPGKLVKKVDACVRTALTGVEFPARRYGTVAVVPYFYQRLPKAGPYESCWNPKGCPSQRDTTAPSNDSSVSRGASTAQNARGKS